MKTLKSLSKNSLVFDLKNTVKKKFIMTIIQKGFEPPPSLLHFNYFIDSI